MVSQVKSVVCSKRGSIVELLAVDETKFKLENQWVYIWSAIDVDDCSILVVHVSTTRTLLDEHVFLRKVLEYCDGKPLILVD